MPMWSSNQTICDCESLKALMTARWVFIRGIGSIYPNHWVLSTWLLSFQFCKSTLLPPRYHAVLMSTSAWYFCWHNSSCVQRCYSFLRMRSCGSLIANFVKCSVGAIGDPSQHEAAIGIGRSGASGQNVGLCYPTITYELNFSALWIHSRYCRSCRLSILRFSNVSAKRGQWNGGIPRTERLRHIERQSDYYLRRVCYSIKECRMRHWDFGDSGQ